MCRAAANAPFLSPAGVVLTKSSFSIAFFSFCSNMEILKRVTAELNAREVAAVGDRMLECRRDERNAPSLHRLQHRHRQQQALQRHRQRAWPLSSSCQLPQGSLLLRRHRQRRAQEFPPRPQRPVLRPQVPPERLQHPPRCSLRIDARTRFESATCQQRLERNATVLPRMQMQRESYERRRVTELPSTHEQVPSTMAQRVWTYAAGSAAWLPIECDTFKSVLLARN